MIITPELLQAALVTRIQETFPGEPVYEEVTPRNFKRPCNLIELQGLDFDAMSLGRNLVAVRYAYLITTFTDTDEVHNSHLPLLSARAMLLLGAFAAGYVAAGDRAAKVAGLKADTSLYDSASVTAAFTVSMERREFVPEAIYPMMRELQTRFLDKKKEEST